MNSKYDDGSTFIIGHGSNPLFLVQKSVQTSLICCSISMSGFFLCKGMKVWHNVQGDLGKVLGNSLVHESFSIILYWPLSDMTIKPTICHGYFISVTWFWIHCTMWFAATCLQGIVLIWKCWQISNHMAQCIQNWVTETKQPVNVPQVIFTL